MTGEVKTGPVWTGQLRTCLNSLSQGRQIAGLTEIKANSASQQSWSWGLAVSASAEAAGY